MKQFYIVLAMLVIGIYSQTVFSQDDLSTLKKTNTQNLKVDTRIDNIGYWKHMAELGLVPYNPTIPVKPADFKGSQINGKGVMVQDSPDVAVSSATNITETENSIFVDPTDNQFVLNSNNSTSWNGSSVGTLYGANYFLGSNGGTTWGGSAQGAGGTNSGDPATAISLDGSRMYVGYIDASYGMGVAYSTNGGASFTNVNVAGGGYLLDKNHLGIDIGPLSPYEGNLYDVWTNLQGGTNDTEIEYSRSTDGGLSWSSSIVLSSAINAGSHNQGVNVQCGPNGEVYVVWTVYDSWPSDENALGFTKSVNGGASFQTATRILSNIKGIRNTGVPQNMRVNSFPSMAVDISGGPNDGNIYIVWTNVGTPGVNSGTAGVYMISSSNGGSTWSTPVKVNQGTGTAYLPWITCDPETGTLAVIFYDNRNTASASCEAWVSYSIDAGATWTDFRVSDVAFTPGPISGLASGYFGDYLAITSRNGMVYPCWADNRDGGRPMTYVSPFVIGLNAAFTADITSVCSGSSIIFTDQSSGSPTSWSWSFPGGSPSTATGAGPHTINYATPGVYNVALTVGDGISTDTETKTGYITVQNIIADFSGSPTSVVVGNSVTFTDNSSCSPSSWSWTFAGGTPGSATGPGPHTIAYNTIGTYNVSLTVSNASYSDTETKTAYIDVTDCNFCTTYYSNTSDDYISNVSFNSINNNSASTTYSDFTAISTNVTTGSSYTISVNITVNGGWIQHCWAWFDWNRDCDFDDAGESIDLGNTPGTAGTHTLTTSIAIPPGAILGSTRMRIAELYAADPGPCTNATYGEAEDYTVIIQSNSSPPVADFIADETKPAINQTVNFTDLSTGTPTSWSWSFNPATVTFVGGSNAASQNPQVQFNAAGYYSATLVATNIYGNGTEIKTDYLLVGTPGNWTGNVSSDWTDALNWENLTVPSASDDVSIPSYSPNWPAFIGDFVVGLDCNNMTMQGASEFTVNGGILISAGKQLICTGSAIISLTGNWQADGIFDPGTGNVNFTGNSNTNITAIGTDAADLITTFTGTNGSNGNMFDIHAINTVTITGFEANLDAGTGDVHVYYKSGTYVGSETNASAWTFVGTASATSSGNGSPTPVPVSLSVTIPAGQVYGFYVHAENGNNYSNGSAVGNVFSSDANIEFLEGCGKLNPVFTGSTFQPRVFNGVIKYEFDAGPGTVTFNNLIISKDFASVENNVDVTVNNNFIMEPGTYYTNPSGTSLNIGGDAILHSDVNGNASFIDDGTTNISGASIMESYYTDNRWHFISSPVSNALSSVFLNIYLKEWDEATYTWNYITPVDYPLNVGEGYEIWSTLGNPTVSFSGSSFNKGNIVPSLTATDVNGGGIGPDEGWNLIGNPYPSAIDVGAPGNVYPGFTWTNLDYTIYFWTGAQYASYNPNSGLGTNGGTRYIPALQGFFVKANLNPVAAIPNSARVHNAQSTYKISGSDQILRLQTTGNGYSDEMIIMTNPEASPGFDKYYDAYQLAGIEDASQIYSKVLGTDLCVNIIPLIEKQDIIEVGFKAGKEGNFSVIVSEIANFDEYEVILLEDILANTWTNLLESPEYYFFGSPDDPDHRFRLHFSNPLDVNENVLSNLTIYAWKDEVHIYSPKVVEGNIDIFSITGHIIHNQANLNEGMNIIPVPAITGYFLVKVQSGNDYITEKVFIRK
ncbi:MAG: PKD domain-containing protein [Bacteroidales bacterium]|nr:PKD domain-containing protein [Bacteroidales bacterium]MCF8404602.1 PKD domain-containing protein [Bacteroidales bacterium]